MPESGKPKRKRKGGPGTYTRETSPYWSKKRKDKLEAQDRYVEHIALGFTPGAAAKVIGRHRNTPLSWMQEDAAFAERVERARIIGEDTALDDPESFEWRRKRYLHNATPWHHRRMIDAIEATGDRETTVIIGPPESAKTTMLADLTTDTVARNPNFRTCFVTAGQPLAKKIANQVKNRLTDDNLFSDFINQYGPFKPEARSENKPWAVTHFTVHKSNHDAKESTVEALGVGSTIYGTRFDRIIFDDPQELKKGILAPHSDDIMVSFRQMSASRLVKGGSQFLLGSRLDEGDFYSLVLEEGAYNHLVFLEALYWKDTMEPAYIPKEEMFTGGRGTNKKVELVPGIEEAIVSFWPEWHSLYDLALIRDAVGEEAWFRAYMQRPQEVAAKSFTADALEKFKERKVGPRIEDPYAILGVDPAYSGPAGFVGMFCDSKRARIAYVDKVKNLGNVSGFAAKLDSACAAMASRGKRPDLILIDSNYYAKLHEDPNVEAIGRKWTAVIEPHETGATKKRLDIGIPRMPASMAAEELLIPFHTEQLRTEAFPLIQECEKWRPDILPRDLEQDLVIAMFMCWLTWTRRIRDQYSPEVVTVSPYPGWIQQTDRLGLIKGLRPGA